MGLKKIEEIKRQVERKRYHQRPGIVVFLKMYVVKLHESCLNHMTLTYRLNVFLCVVDGHYVVKMRLVKDDGRS